jgi:hypothetical protein
MGSTVGQLGIGGLRSLRAWLCAALIGVGLPLGARADEQTYGFVWADQPSASSYAPAANYAYNGSGTPPQITRSGVGQYQVSFPGLSALYATRGNVQVTAYGSSTTFCKVVSWTGDVVSVACFADAGNPADSQYTVLFLFPDSHASSHFGFAWADQSANASYTPDPTYSYNAGGAGAITATRSGTGNYTITWSGISAVGSGGGHIQVTAYGPGNAQCRSDGWGSERAIVRCSDPTGAAVDSQYTILYWRPAVGDHGLAFAQAGQPSTASYTPNASYSYNAGGGAITATRSSTGVYNMSWTGMAGVGTDGGNVHVTAYGEVDVRCQVLSWGPDNANVGCFDPAGNPVDSEYQVLFVKPPKKAWAQTYAFAWANQPAAASYTPDTTYSYNYLGGPITITRSSAGVYSVQFASFDSLGVGGNVQVTSYGAYASAGEYCKVVSWGSNTVSVDCFDATGAAADSYFTALYTKGTSSTALAYADADIPLAPSYTPNTSFSYNPSGGAITATRSGIGSYSMTWTGFGVNGTGGGHPNVTAYGVGSARCQIAGWGGDTVSVLCFDSAGNPADRRYSISYLRPDATDDGIAYAWADQSSTASYTPSPSYSFNSGDGAVTAQHLGTGQYSVSFAGFDLRGLQGGHVQVNGYGLSDERCRVDHWTSSNVFVNCNDSANNPVDTRFDVLFLKPVSLPEPGGLGALAAGAAMLGGLARRRSRWPGRRLH